MHAHFQRFGTLPSHNRRRGAVFVETIMASTILIGFFAATIEMLNWYKVRNAIRYTSFVTQRSIISSVRDGKGGEEALKGAKEAARLAFNDAIGVRRDGLIRTILGNWIPRNYPIDVEFDINQASGHNAVVKLKLSHNFRNPCTAAERILRHLSLPDFNRFCPDIFRVVHESPILIQGYSGS